MAMKLHLESTPIEIEDRTFVLKEMSGAAQSEYYSLINEVAQAQKRVYELMQLDTEERAQSGVEDERIKRGQEEVDSANLRLWQMMLRPTDSAGQITSEWVQDNTNSRIGEEVINEQLRLNRFADTMGKLTAQAQQRAKDLGVVAMEVNPAQHSGPVFAAL